MLKFHFHSFSAYFISSDVVNLGYTLAWVKEFECKGGIKNVLSLLLNPHTKNFRNPVHPMVFNSM